MQEHKFSEDDANEPEGGWEGGPDLYDTELVSVVLCKYTGYIVNDVDQPCEHADTHAPGPCFTLFHSATALTNGTIDIARFPTDITVTEVRAGAFADDTPTGVTHA